MLHAAAAVLPAFSPGKRVWKVLQFNLVHVFDRPFFRGEGVETWDWDCDWELASSSGPCTCTSVVSMAWATCCTRVAEFSVSQPLGNTSWLTWLGFLGSQHSVGRTMGTSSTLSLWGVAQTPWAVAVTVTDVQMDAEKAQRKIYSILLIKWNYNVSPY